MSVIIVESTINFNSCIVYFFPIQFLFQMRCSYQRTFQSFQFAHLKTISSMQPHLYKYNDSKHHCSNTKKCLIFSFQNKQFSECTHPIIDLPDDDRRPE